MAAIVLTGVQIVDVSASGPAKPLAAVARDDGTRIWYAAGKYPLTTLPDGSVLPLKSVLHTSQAMRFGEWIWEDTGVPAGSVSVHVDLSRQLLSVLRAGHEIGTTVILYGTDDTPTPIGVFPVLERAAEHRSNLYDADMPFMLRLTDDGVAIHAGTVLEGAGTHGCIGIPLEFARLLFSATRRGDLVAISRQARIRMPA